MNLDACIRDIPDFPRPGILFKDITPLLQDPEAFQLAIDTMATNLEWVDVIVWLDARWFLFASALAYKLKKPLVIVRKSWKLPFKKIGIDYGLEYGKSSFELNIDAFESGKQVAIIDDLLATGGSAQAAISLVKQLWWEVHSCHFVIELEWLWGREKLDWEIFSLLKY